MPPVLLTAAFLSPGRSIAVEPFGVLLALGLGFGVLLSLRLARGVELSPGVGASALVPAAVAALVGARGLYVLGSVERETLLEVLALGRGGLSGYGALMLGTAVFAWALWRLQQPIWAWLDVAAPGALLAAAAARLGCYWTGCDAGLAMVAPGRIATRLGAFRDATTPLHPTQLYESALLLTIVVALAWGRRFQRRHGDAFFAAALAYAAVRAGLEPLRAEVDRGFFGPFSATLLCAAASAVAIAGLLARRAQRLPSSTW